MLNICCLFCHPHFLNSSHDSGDRICSMDLSLSAAPGDSQSRSFPIPCWPKLQGRPVQNHFTHLFPAHEGQSLPVHLCPATSLYLSCCLCLRVVKLEPWSSNYITVLGKSHHGQADVCLPQQEVESFGESYRASVNLAYKWQQSLPQPSLGPLSVS